MRIVPIDFLGQGAMLTPVDAHLHDLAVDFCRREVLGEVNLSQLAKVWIALEGDKVLGVFGYCVRPDVPLCRAIDADALRGLALRYSAFLADQGIRGHETFIHVSRREKPEQKCPGWAEVLKEWDAKLADRVTVTVR